MNEFEDKNEAEKEAEEQKRKERAEKSQKAAAEKAAAEKEAAESKKDDVEGECAVRDESTFGELEIDETFAVRGVGIVVSGTVTAGRIYPNQKLFLGPFTDCTFKEILVRSVHMKRVQVEDAIAGETCSVALRFIKRKEVCKYTVFSMQRERERVNLEIFVKILKMLEYLKMLRFWKMFGKCCEMLDD